MDLAWWIAVIGVPLVAAIFGIDFYIHKDANAQNEKKDAEIEALHTRINASNRELYDYKVSSAQLFATSAAMSEMKRDMVAALGRIEDKLDRLAERNARVQT